MSDKLPPCDHDDCPPSGCRHKPKTETLYAITCPNKSGMRTFIYANQRRHFKATRAEAVKHMKLILSHTPAETLRQVFGEHWGKMAVRPVECYVGGDAIGIWFD